MMFTRKTFLWMFLGTIVVFMTIAVVILLNLPHQNAIGLINCPAMNLIPKNSKFYQSVMFRVMAKETSRLPQIITTEIMKKNGMVSILHGSMSEETSSFFDFFVANSSNGKAAQIIIMVYTTEGDPIFMNVLFDQVQYLAFIDKTHERLNFEGEEYESFRYDHLNIITQPETGSKFVILTNNTGLTYEQLHIAQIGSDMESIDSYQLFSYSK